MKLAGQWRGHVVRHLAAQLAEPRGIWGLVTGAAMNVANSAINKHAVGLLDISSSHYVLEIGFGGGSTLEALLQRAPAGRVYGIERSATMCEAAQRSYDRDLRSGRLELVAGDASVLPWTNALFDRVVSVNTIYFWEAPLEILREMRRVLKPDGVGVLAYRPKALMERLPVSSHGFRLYDDDEVLDLMHDAGLEVTEVTFGGRAGHEHTCMTAQPLAS